MWLIREHHPSEALDAAELLFERWPCLDTASAAARRLGADWPQHRERIIDQLRPWPYRLIPFLLGDGDAQRAWDEAHAARRLVAER